MKISVISGLFYLLSSSSRAVYAAEADDKTTTTIDFVFPLTSGVSSKTSVAMDAMVKRFNDVNTQGIIVNAIYAGTYAETFDYVQQRIAEGNIPAAAVLELKRLVPMMREDKIIFLDDYVEKEGGQSYLEQFWPALLLNAQKYDHLWGMPMMRSTPLLYYNQDMFDAAGVSAPPTNWDELVSAAKSLTTDSKKGLCIPNLWSDWMFASFSREAGSQIIDDADWNIATYENDENRKALNVWNDLARGGNVPLPLVAWGDAVPGFNNQEYPMLYYSSGGITAVREGASASNFTWGAAFLPGGPEGYGVETAGGDVHILNNIPKEQQDAAWEWIKFLASQEQAAEWSVASGYIAVNKGAYDTKLMNETTAETPQFLVPMKQLEYAHG